MVFSNIVGLMYNLGIAYVNIFNDGRFNSSMWVLPKFVLVYGFIMQMLYVMYIGTIGILYHDVGIVMGIPITTLILREPCRYCILGFCSMMNVYRIINSLSVGNCIISFNHGKGSKVSFHSCPKPHQV
jgi:hypothetical protein